MGHDTNSGMMISDRSDLHLKDLAKENTLFRKAIYTGPFSQTVMMCVPPGAELGQEAHLHSEVLLLPVKGRGRVTVNSRTRMVSQRDVIVVPAGSIYNLKNTGTYDLKLLAIYAPPVYLDGTLQKTQEDAQAAAREAIQHAWEQ